MGSIAGDRAGDVAIGFSVSGTTTFPSIDYVGHAATGEERRRVVAGHVGVRAPDAVPVPARVNQRRVPLSDGLGVETEPTQRAGPEAREEDVGRLEELVEHAPTGLGAQVDGE